VGSRAGRRRASDRPDHRGDFDLIAYAAVSVAEDEAAAREAARPPVAFIAGGAAPPVLKRHGIDPAAASEVGDRVSAGEFSAAFERVTPRDDRRVLHGGHPEIVRERAAAVAEHADGLVVGPPLGPDLEGAVDLAAEAVDGLFKSLARFSRIENRESPLITWG